MSSRIPAHTLTFANVLDYRERLFPVPARRSASAVYIMLSPCVCLSVHHKSAIAELFDIINIIMPTAFLRDDVPEIDVYPMTSIAPKTERTELHYTPLSSAPHWLPLFRDDWSSRLPALCTSHWHQKRRRISVVTADIRLVSEHGRRSLRSSSNRTLAVRRTRSSFGDRSFAAAGPHLWNSLPTNLRQMTSYGQFRRHLKSCLFWLGLGLG